MFHLPKHSTEVGLPYMDNIALLWRRWTYSSFKQMISWLISRFLLVHYWPPLPLFFCWNGTINSLNVNVPVLFVCHYAHTYEMIFECILIWILLHYLQEKDTEKILYGLDDINDVPEIVIVIPLSPLCAAFLQQFRSLTLSLLILLFLLLSTGRRWNG